MPKRILQAAVRVPEHPRVRFFTFGSPDKKALRDVTARVVSVAVESSGENGGGLALVRLDAQGGVVWTTRHPSLEELKWHAEFEYELPAHAWQGCGTDSQLDATVAAELERKALKPKTKRFKSGRLKKPEA